LGLNAVEFCITAVDLEAEIDGNMVEFGVHVADFVNAVKLASVLLNLVLLK